MHTHTLHIESEREESHNYLLLSNASHRRLKDYRHQIVNAKSKAPPLSGTEHTQPSFSVPYPPPPSHLFNDLSTGLYEKMICVAQNDLAPALLHLPPVWFVFNDKSTHARRRK